VQCDVGKEDDMKRLFKQAISKFGTVDICVANSRIQQDYALHEMPLSA
jgi:glucose 1-dehydrogenase